MGISLSVYWPQNVMERYQNINITTTTAKPSFGAQFDVISLYILHLTVTILLPHGRNLTFSAVMPIPWINEYLRMLKR